MHRAAAHRADHRRVRRVDQAAALLRVQVHRAAGVEQPGQCGAAATRAAPGDHQRAPRRTQQRGGAQHVGRVGPQYAARLRGHVLVEHHRVGHRLAQHVGRDLHVHRPGRVAVAVGHRPRLVEVARDLVGGAQRARAARDRRHDRHVVDALQRAEIVLWHRRAAADQEHRHTLQVRVGHRGHTVGHAGAGGGHRDAHLARQRRVRVRHVHRRTFVAHVDDAHVQLREVVPDRLDVAALQAEDAVDAARDQETGDQLSNAAAGAGVHGSSLATRWLGLAWRACDAL